MAEAPPLPAEGDEQPVGEAFDIGAKISSAMRRGDIMLALGVVAILVVLILPMPKWLLDISLAFSITFST